MIRLSVCVYVCVHARARALDHSHVTLCVRVCMRAQNIVSAYICRNKFVF